jgi:SAM-dependent methyltransferase
MAAEASKAALRRLHDPAFMARYMVGHALDVGSGEDGLSKQMHLWPLLRSVRDWDVGDGDAMLLEDVPDASFDLVHSSHSLEHMRSPEGALLRWLDVTKPGGHVVVLVPDEDMYEQGQFPSTFNPDHKSTFTTYKFESWTDRSVNLTDVVMAVAPRAQLEKLERLTHTWNPQGGRYDRTAGVGESAIEMVLRRRA